MSYIARKLCEEIVEPALEQTSTKTIPLQQCCSKKSSVKFNDKVSRSVIVEKKKVINKLLPRESNESKSIVNEFISSEILVNKRFLDISVNTLITGPIHCEIDSNIANRKRDGCKNCMCSRRKGYCRLASKQTQTLCYNDYSHKDKATAKSLETVTCGTQFFRDTISKNVFVSIASDDNNKKYITSNKHLSDAQTSRNRMDFSSKNLLETQPRSIMAVVSKNLSDVHPRNIKAVASKHLSDKQPTSIMDVSNKHMSETQPRNLIHDSSSFNTRNQNFDNLSYKHWALDKYQRRRGPDF